MIDQGDLPSQSCGSRQRMAALAWYTPLRQMHLFERIIIGHGVHRNEGFGRRIVNTLILVVSNEFILRDRQWIMHTCKKKEGCLWLVPLVQQVKWWVFAQGSSALNTVSEEVISAYQPCKSCTLGYQYHGDAG